MILLNDRKKTNWKDALKQFSVDYQIWCFSEAFKRHKICLQHKERILGRFRDDDAASVFYSAKNISIQRFEI